MTADELRTRFPHGSEQFIRDNASDLPRTTVPPDNRPAPSAEPQQALRDAPVEPPQGEALYAGRVLVRITSYRRRLCDPDNLIGKWFLDACRYSRLIRGDRPEDIAYQVSQEKVRSKAEERTEILIESLPTP